MSEKLDGVKQTLLPGLHKAVIDGFGQADNVNLVALSKLDEASVLCVSYQIVLTGILLSAVAMNPIRSAVFLIIRLSRVSLRYM